MIPRPPKLDERKEHDLTKERKVLPYIKNRKARNTNRARARKQRGDKPHGRTGARTQGKTEKQCPDSNHHTEARENHRGRILKTICAG